MTPSTSTLVMVGVSATVRMMSAATRNSNPSRMAQDQDDNARSINGDADLFNHGFERFHVQPYRLGRCPPSCRSMIQPAGMQELGGEFPEFASGLLSREPNSLAIFILDDEVALVEAVMHCRSAANCVGGDGVAMHFKGSGLVAHLADQRKFRPRRDLHWPVFAKRQPDSHVAAVSVHVFRHPCAVKPIDLRGISGCRLRRHPCVG